MSLWWSIKLWGSWDISFQASKTSCFDNFLIIFDHSFMKLSIIEVIVFCYLCVGSFGNIFYCSIVFLLLVYNFYNCGFGNNFINSFRKVFFLRLDFRWLWGYFVVVLIFFDNFYWHLYRSVVWKYVRWLDLGSQLDFCNIVFIWGSKRFHYSLSVQYELFLIFSFNFFFCFVLHVQCFVNINNGGY